MPYCKQVRFFLVFFFQVCATLRSLPAVAIGNAHAHALNRDGVLLQFTLIQSDADRVANESRLPAGNNSSHPIRCYSGEGGISTYLCLRASVCLSLSIIRWVPLVHVLIRGIVATSSGGSPRTRADLNSIVRRDAISSSVRTV